MSRMIRLPLIADARVASVWSLRWWVWQSKKCAGQSPGPRYLSLVSVALYFFKDALGLRVALNLLDEALLISLLESPDATKQQRGYRHNILG